MAFSSAWSDVIRANWATCQLFIDLRTGSYQDLSANARVVTFTAGTYTQQWLTQTQGKGFDVGGVPVGSGRLSIPHAAELNLQPSGTVACFTRAEFGFAAGARIAWKRTGAVSSYDFYESIGGAGAGTIKNYDGASDHLLGVYSIPTVRSLATSFTIGAIPLGYANGVQVGPAVAVWNPGADAGALYLANSSAGASGSPGVGWHAFLLFNTRLTGAEISQLHNDFLTAPFVL
jgi:hypothetical protein